MNSVAVPAIPVLIDAHCHLQDGHLRTGLTAALTAARQAGVGAMFCNATNENDWDFVCRLAQTEDGVVPWLGLHPWFVRQAGSNWLHRLQCLAESTRCGIGEIGLDGALPGLDWNGQLDAFEAQLKLAADLDRPVAMHCRKAWEPFLRVLTKYKGEVSGLVHSFSGSLEIGREIEKMGFYISFSASILRPANKKARRACAGISGSHLLIETDSPAIAPPGVAKDHNQPAFLVLVAEEAARLRKVSFDQIRETTWNNSIKVAAKIFKSKLTLRENE